MIDIVADKIAFIKYVQEHCPNMSKKDSWDYAVKLWKDREWLKELFLKQ